MGVHGLTTYLREHQRSLAQTITFQKQSESSTPLIIDGWSFIYAVHEHSRQPWVFGGEYKHFLDLVVKVAQAWIDVGFVLHYVFDGPYPSAKFSTNITRVSDNVIQPSLLFFRMSQSSRASLGFQREVAIIPPLCYAVCLEALRSLPVEIHIADVEGDPYAVELAGRLGGFVAGRDSDFVILNTEGYRGYVPLDEMIWTSVEDAPDQQPEDDGGFIVAHTSKASKKAAAGAPLRGQGLIPPNGTTELTLTCSAYAPSDLATHLKLPITLLPLFASLVGNDFTPDRRVMQWQFFERDLTVSQRITRVASTLQSIVSQASTSLQKRRPKRSITTVIDLIDTAIEVLLLRPSTGAMGSGEKEAMVEKTAEATLQYAISKHLGGLNLWPTSACALHLPEQCPLVTNLSSLGASASEGRENITPRIVELYVSAYRRGYFQPNLMNVYNSGTMWPKLFLEDPDKEPTARSIGRPIREWVYAILNDGVPLPDPYTDEDGEEGTEEVTEVEDADEDELIDVVEEDSEDENGDPLAGLRGALQELHVPGSTSSSEISLPSRSYPQHQPVRPKVIIEHVRRGTKLAQEDVSVPPLSKHLSSLVFRLGFDEQLPLQLQPEEERLAVFLHILSSDTASIRALPPDQFMAIVALRWVVFILHKRAEEHGFTKDKERERWTRSEVCAMLMSFSWTPSTATSEANIAPSCDSSISCGPAVTPLLDNRNIQLVAQISSALEAVEMLAQALLLGERVKHPAYTFSGQRFHALLTSQRVQTSDTEDIGDTLLDACIEGLQEAMSEERGKKSKKERKTKSIQSTAVGVSKSLPPPGARGGVGRQGQSLFRLLLDLDEDSASL